MGFRSREDEDNIHRDVPLKGGAAHILSRLVDGIAPGLDSFGDLHHDAISDVFFAPLRGRNPTPDFDADHDPMAPGPSRMSSRRVAIVSQWV